MVSVPEQAKQARVGPGPRWGQVSSGSWPGTFEPPGTVQVCGSGSGECNRFGGDG